VRVLIINNKLVTGLLDYLDKCELSIFRRSTDSCLSITINK
jgi:hypothetical protein